MTKKFPSLIKLALPLLLILIFDLCLRLFKITDFFYFSFDEEVPAFIGRRLILWHHVPLIGGVTPFHVHLGPYFYWFYAFLLFLSKLNPIIWGYAGAIISIITVIFIFLFSFELKNKKLAVTAAVFWSFSFLTNLYDRHLWALYWAPLVSVVTLYSLQKIILGKNKFIYLLGITLALCIHADPSNLVFIAVTLTTWILYKIPIRKSTIFAASIIPLFVLPLLVFDLRHNFANTKPAASFFQGNSPNKLGLPLKKVMENTIIFPRAFARLSYTSGENEIAGQYSYCQQYIQQKYKSEPRFLVLMSAIVILGFLIWSFKFNNKSGWRLISVTILIYFFAIHVYGTLINADIFEHYLTGLFPLFLIIFALIVSMLPKKLWLLALGIFISLNLYTLSQAKNSIGLRYMNQAVSYTQTQVQNKDFSLESLSTCWRYTGYRYLFTVNGEEPVKSFVDPNIGYLYGTTPVADKHPSTVAAFITHDFIGETNDFYKKYAVYKSHEKQNAIFGNIEVIIMDNSSGWFDKYN